MEDGARRAVEPGGDEAPQDRPVELPGAILRAAREAAGISVEAVADSLHLHAAQIEALENDDASRFSAPIFYHGFLRNYARLLGLDPEPLLAAVRTVEPAEPPSLTSEHTGAARARRRRVAADFAGSGLIVILVLLGLGLVWLLTRGSDPAVEEVAGHVPAAPAMAPAGDAPSGDPDAAPDAEPQAGAPVAAAPPAPPAAEDEIVLRFSGRSWVEISDARGRRLAVRMGEEGETLRVRGEPPFDILLGNAPNVTLDYNGTPYTDIPANRQNVASFRLGPGRE